MASYDEHVCYQSAGSANSMNFSPVRVSSACRLCTSDSFGEHGICSSNVTMSPQPLRGKRLSDINFKTRLFGGISVNARTVVAPLIALTMAGLLYVYSTASVSAAKKNAKSHRIADGGQISWYFLPSCSTNVNPLFGTLYTSPHCLFLNVRHMCIC